jgi:hypothetical protein
VTRKLIVSRLCYVLGGGIFASIALILTRRVGYSLQFVSTILLMTTIVASVASSQLIRRDRVAGLPAWLLAGVLLPMVVAIGFPAVGYLVALIRWGYGSIAPMYWLTVSVAAAIAVPLGVVGHLLLRWLIKRRFYPPNTPNDCAAA